MSDSMKSLRLLYLLVTISLACLLTSCLADVTDNSRPPTTTAIGKTNEIVVIADDAVWESAVGDTMRYYFGAAYPIMPSPEPIFDLRHFTPDYFYGDESRQRLRTYIVLTDYNNLNASTTVMAEGDIGKETFRRYRELDQGPTAKIGRNKWAQNQLVTYLIGDGADGIIASIKENYANVAARINEHDRKQIDARTYLEGVHHGISDRIVENYGVKMKVPQGYLEAITQDGFTWIAKNGDDATYNLMFYTIPYTDQSQMTLEAAIALRNQLGEQYITTETVGSYMTINDEDLPVYDYVTDIGGHYTLETRGVWEMTKDFMGGPYFNWLILDEDSQEIIMIDAFIVAPGEMKRDHMQMLEYIVKNAQLVKGM